VLLKFSPEGDRPAFEKRIFAEHGGGPALRIAQRLDDLQALKSVAEIGMLRSAGLEVINEPPGHFSVTVVTPLRLLFRADPPEVGITADTIVLLHLFAA
jgi:hypothetical protein